MNGWVLGLAANAAISVSYLAVATLLAVNITKTKQWRANPLAFATCMIFLSCGLGHGVVALQLAGAAFSGAAVTSARLVYGSAYEIYWDVVTAAIGIWYWTQRRRFPGLVSGTAVFEDLRQRQRRALLINDNVVQGLVRAKLNLDLRRDGPGREALRETLAASKDLVTGIEEGKAS